MTGREHAAAAVQSMDGVRRVVHSRPPVGRRHLLAPRRWTIWSLPRSALVYVLAVDALAVGLAMLHLGFLHPPGAATQTEWARFGTLAGAAVVYVELSRRIDRMRRIYTRTPFVVLNGVWIFAATLVLPPGLTAVLVVLVYTHEWLRVWWQVRRGLAHRQVFNAGMIVVTSLASAAVFDALSTGSPGDPLPGSLFALGVAVLTYAVLNWLLVAVVITLSTSEPIWRGVLGRLSDKELDLATLCLGAAAAVLLWQQLGLVLLVMPPLLALHRNVLIHQLEEAVRTDAKTGLFNALHWHEMAGREIARAQRHGGPLGVLMVDLDHFKRVNDTHGHLAGDEVLGAVAKVLKTEVREYDLVGRFGGEEFAILLPGLAEPEVCQVAERIRTRVAELTVSVPGAHGPVLLTRLTVSIGTAAYPRDGSSLDELMLAADAALYTAKAGGRNQVAGR